MKATSLLATLLLSLLVACDRGAPGSAKPVSDTGVRKVTAKVKTGSDGMTVEQRQIRKRLEIENQPGAVKHLYVVSSYSGDCILYSTVQGKVTSSGKRLSPYSVSTSPTGQYGHREGIKVSVGGRSYTTGEVLQDDGTYGSSSPYLYWFDVRGNYHQHYVSGGQIVHVSDVPMTFPKVILNLEESSG